MVRRVKVPGTPYRLRVQEEPTSKVDMEPQQSVAQVPVVIEVKGGRSSTASAMRAARVMHQLEEEGGQGATVQVAGERATVEGQADRAQVESIAKLPFVKKITAA